MMVMIGIIDVAIVLLVLLVFFWLVTNVIRYLSYGKQSGWWGLSEKWIKNNKNQKEKWNDNN